MEAGAIDRMIARWEAARPDLDASCLGVIARISRLAHAIDRDAARLLQQYRVSVVEFQLLAAIRMATPDHHPAPRDLLEPLMVSSGGLTSRIDRLEKVGLVERLRNPGDRRGVLLQLTKLGHGLVDRITTAYLFNQNVVLDKALTRDEQLQLTALLRKLLVSMREGTDAVARA